MFLFKKLSLFIYWLLWVFVALRSLSLVEASGNYSLLWGTGLLTAATPLVAEPSCRHVGSVSFRQFACSRAG